MRRRKRFTIKLVALGLALAAISASPAQAKLDEGLGMPRQSEPILVVSPDDRNLDLTPAVQIEPNVIVSPDDRRLSRMSPVAAAQPSLVSSDDGFELGTFGMGGIILLVGAAGTLLALHQTRKGKLASA